MNIEIENFFVEGIKLHKQGKIQLAANFYDKVLELKSNHSGANHNLALIEIGNKNYLKAKSLIELALKDKPTSEQYWSTYINFYLHRKDFLNAKKKLESAIAIGLNKNFCNNLRNQIENEEKTNLKNTNDTEPSKDILQNLTKLLSDGEFEKVLLRVKELEQKFPNSLNLINISGVANLSLENFEEAISIFNRGLILDPNLLQIHNNLGEAYRKKSDLEKAIIHFKNSLKLNPDYAQGNYNLAVSYFQKKSYNDSIYYNKEAIRCNPSYYEAYYNLAVTFLTIGDIPSSIENLDKCLKIDPNNEEALAQKLYRKSVICDWSDYENEQLKINNFGKSKIAFSPSLCINLNNNPSTQKLVSTNWANSKFQRNILPKIEISKSKCKKLRIGYFSADFCEHPVSYLLNKVIELHDRSSFEIHGFSISGSEEDTMRKKMRRSFDFFYDVENLTDKNVALLSRKKEIDIAIDLTGYTKNCRTGIFANRAAPIQINYLGFVGTMGADFIDYIIADEFLIPKENQKFYSEKMIYLPHCFQSQDDTLTISKVIPSRQSLGLPDDGFVFCVINAAYKIRPTEFNIWMELLKQVDGSVLWLYENNKWMKANLIKEAELRGVNAERLVFCKRTNHDDYLAQLKHADLFLDTFNYNAGTTCSNALWAGLPVLTKSGQYFSTRIAGSLLTALGMHELVTYSNEEYEKLALRLANDKKYYALTREKLIDMRKRSPLFKSLRFTKNLENGYKSVFNHYMQGLNPKNIYIKD